MSAVVSVRPSARNAAAAPSASRSFEVTTAVISGCAASTSETTRSPSSVV